MGAPLVVLASEMSEGRAPNVNTYFKLMSVLLMQLEHHIHNVKVFQF
jgi:hypothetical protein